MFWKNRCRNEHHLESTLIRVYILIDLLVEKVLNKMYWAENSVQLKIFQYWDCIIEAACEQHDYRQTILV